MIDAMPTCTTTAAADSRTASTRGASPTAEAPPTPDWKRRDWAYDVLPEADPPRAAGPLKGES
jgi:hypothetical protein